MAYEFKVMTQEQAESIASWHYDGKYSFYDMEADEEDLADFLNPQKRGNLTFSVVKGNEMIGFFSVNVVAERTLDIGLGMRPDLTGKGKGKEFIRDCIAFIQANFEADKITLSVATFNQRAIKVYRKIGFNDIKIYNQDTNGGTFEFLKMEYVCK